MRRITLTFIALLVTCCLWQVQAQTTTTGSNPTVVTLPDNDPVGITSLVNISGIPAGASLVDVEVDLAINHTWVGDMDIRLQAPTGEEIILVTRPGTTTGGAGDSSNLSSAFPITFTDAATEPAENMGAAEAGGDNVCEAAPNICSFLPNDGLAPNLFADFAALVTGNASDLNGNWVIQFSDNAGGDLGDFFVPELRITHMGGIVGNPPVISCPMVAPVDNDAGECGAVVNFSDATAVDIEDGVLTAVQTMGPASGTLFDVGDTTVQFSVTDSDGNTSTCSFVVTVNDAEDAMITCPDDITVDQDAGTCGAVVEYDTPMVVDNCPVPTTTTAGTFSDVIRITEPGLTTLGNLFSFAVPSGAAVTDGTLTVRVFGDIDGVAGGGNDEFWTISDESSNVVGTAGGTGDFADQCVNEITEVFTIAMADIDTWTGDGSVDFTADDIAGNINISGLCNPGEYVELEFTYDFEEVVADVVQTAGIASGGTFPVGTTTNTFEYTDVGGNTVSCSFDVTVVDTEAPVIECVGEPLSGDIMMNGSFESGDLSGWTAVDNPNPFLPWGAYNANNGGGFFADALPTEGAWLAGNGFDGDAGEAILFQDVSVPAGITTAELSWDENIDYNITFCGPCSDRIYEVQIRDLSDNVLEVLQAVTAVGGTIEDDNVWESLTADLSAYAGQDIRIAFWQNIPASFEGPAKFAVDNVALNIAVPAVGIDVVLDANGMASIPASDLILNVTDCSSTTVGAGGGLNPCDSSNPSNGLENGYFTDPGSGFTIAGDFTVEADVDFELNQATFNLFHDIGETISSVDVYYFDDAAGVPGTLLGSELAVAPTSQSVIGSNFGFDVSEAVVDLTPFAFASGAADTQYWVAIQASSSSGGITAWEVSTASVTGAETAFSGDGGATWAPAGGGDDPVFVFSGTCNVEPTATVDFDCSQIGENFVEVTVTDANGNSSTCIATVNVIDDIAPVIECGFVPTLTDSATDAPGSVITDANPTTTSVINVAANESITDLDVDLDISHTWVGDMLITLESPAGTVVELYDGSLLFCGDDDMTVTLDDAATGGNVNDQCGAGTIDGTFTPSSPLAAFNGESTAGDWTLSITDNAAGDDGVLNSWGITYGFNGPAEDVVIELDENGMATIDPFDIISNVDEACGIATAAVDITEVFCSDIGTPLTVTAFVLDNGGNPASCQATVIVVDNLAPVLTCPADLTVGDNTGNGDHLLGDLFADGTVTATDNCTDPVTVTTQDPAPGTVLPAGVTTVTMTAEDEFGNVSTCMFDVTVDPTLAIDDQILESGITLFPNPVREQLTVSNTTSIGLEDAKIYDANGRLVQTLNLGDLQGQKTFDVGSLASGIYMVQIQGQGATTVKRLIKQ